MISSKIGPTQAAGKQLCFLLLIRKQHLLVCLHAARMLVSCQVKVEESSNKCSNASSTLQAVLGLCRAC
jgi:hypothetical protein